METHHTQVLVIGSGTAGSNSARAAIAAGAVSVTLVQPRTLINTCVEEGCMPSKSVLAGAHHGEDIKSVVATRDAHIERLLKALTDSLDSEAFTIARGVATFIDEHTVEVDDDGEKTTYTADAIVLATGSHPFVPPIEGLAAIGDRLWVSDDIVARKAQLTEVPERILTIGGGPIGLELSTFFHDMGSESLVLQRRNALGLFDPEFGEERVRASKDASSFPIELNAELIKAELTDDDQVRCSIKCNDDVREEIFDRVIVATGRRANLDNYNLPETVERDERGNLVLSEQMQTSLPHIYAAGDVAGHHQILHYAAEMGKVAGHNAAGGETRTMDYDRHMLAVSFDQFPSALIGLTETEANKRGIEVVTAIRNFNSIGLGILKRQEYGLWKLVVEKATGKIIGSQVMGPDSAGELIQLLVPAIHNSNTVADITDMTWYHPTYAEILLSLARDINNQLNHLSR